MTPISLADAFLLNPQVSLSKGSVAPFVEMAALRPFTRTVTASIEKPFSGGMKFMDGDVLMARITPSLENGKTSVYRSPAGRETQPAFGSTEFIVIRGRDGVSDSAFAYYLFTSEDLRQFAISQMNGSSGRQRVQQDALARYIVDLPSLSEQRNIAAVLGALDDKSESNRRAIELMEQLVRATFQEMFSAERTPNGVPVSEIVSINVPRKLAMGQMATYVGMSSLPEFSPEIYDWEPREFRGGQKFVGGDVLLARITPCLENGKTAVVDMLGDAEVGWGSTEYIVLSPKGSISTPWIYSLVRSGPIRDWAIRSMSGTSGRQRFQAEGFDNYPILAPAEPDLLRFNTFSEPLFAKMSQLRDEVKRLAVLRNALLPELLAGRIRPAEAAEAVETGA